MITAIAWIVVAPAFVFGAIAASLLVGWWWAYWLFPFWAILMPEVGVPAISFWHFWALITFLKSRPAQFSDIRKSCKDWEQQDYWALVAMWVFGPILSYYILMWMVS